MWEYPDVEIGSQDIVKTTDLLISKESVWHPDFCGIDQCQILDLIWGRGEKVFIDRRRIMNQNPNLYCYVPTFLWIVASRRSIFASKWFEIYTPERRLSRSIKNVNLLTILTSLISENPRIKMLTNISVAASRLSGKLIFSALQSKNFYWSRSCLICSTRTVSMTRLEDDDGRRCSPALCWSQPQGGGSWGHRPGSQECHPKSPSPSGDHDQAY